MYRQQKIGVVIPAYNVEKQIDDTVKHLPDIIDRIYVVDDGSKDNTAGVAGAASDRVRLLRHPTNRGPGAAMTTGFLEALRDDLDIVVKVDGDGQMRPDQIERLIQPIVEQKADYTKGDRLSCPDLYRTMPRFRLFGNIILTWLTRIASGYWQVQDTQNGFIAISKRALREIDVERIYPYYGYLNDILVRLNVGGFTIRDVAMPAHYGNERSSIRLKRYVPKVSLFLLSTSSASISRGRVSLGTITPSI